MSKVKITGHASGTGVLTVTAPNTSSDRTITLPDATGTLLNSDGDGSSLTGTSKIVQVVNVMDGAVATGTTTLPDDDTVPQNTEGDEYMTLAITPTSATNKLLIQVVGVSRTSGAGHLLSMALFQDTTANALAALGQYTANFVNSGDVLVLNHYMTSGTTSATTFKVRIGTNASTTVTFNGKATARHYGDVSASSITITEIAV